MIKEIATDELINKLIGLESSTTLFLESIALKPLQVCVLGHEEPLGQSGILERTSLLYFTDKTFPVIYSRSNFYLEQLKHQEYQQLKDGALPIGKFISSLHGTHNVLKEQIRVVKKPSNSYATALRVLNTEIICKEYEYVVGGRKIGRIMEAFNEESIVRL